MQSMLFYRPKLILGNLKEFCGNSRNFQKKTQEIFKKSFFIKKGPKINLELTTVTTHGLLLEVYMLLDNCRIILSITPRTSSNYNVGGIF